MSDAAWTVLPATIAAIAAAIVSIIGVLISKKNSAKIEEVHKTTNSKMDLLLKTKGDAMEAEGALRGAAEEKARHL